METKPDAFCLDAVWTVPEIQEAYGKARATVIHAMFRNFTYRQAGKVYLVTRASVITHWGKPKKEVQNGS